MQGRGPVLVLAMVIKHAIVAHWAGGFHRGEFGPPTTARCNGSVPLRFLARTCAPALRSLLGMSARYDAAAKCEPCRFAPFSNLAIASAGNALSISENAARRFVTIASTSFRSALSPLAPDDSSRCTDSGSHDNSRKRPQGLLKAFGLGSEPRPKTACLRVSVSPKVAIGTPRDR
jgi:hypothetical protein